MPTKETQLVAKLVETIKDLLVITQEMLDNPSNSQKQTLKRKLKIVSRRFPKLSEEIKASNRRPDTQILTFQRMGLPEITDDEL